MFTAHNQPLVSMWAVEGRGSSQSQKLKIFQTFHISQSQHHGRCSKELYINLLYVHLEEELKFICFSNETLHNGVSWYFNLGVGS